MLCSLRSRIRQCGSNRPCTWALALLLGCVAGCGDAAASPRSRAPTVPRAEDERPVRAARPPAAASEKAPPRSRPLVVIDPGHGGEDRGSPGLYGLWEGELALDMAQRVRARLGQLLPSVRTRLTRESDVALALEERAAMANALGADLFVSMHLNAANGVVERGGVTTFVLDVDNDRNVLRLAARENGTSTTNVGELQFLLGTLARADQHERSLRLAHHVQRGALLSGRRFLPSLADRGVRSAMFNVLVSAQMPAILLEGSFLTQPDEAHWLTEAAYRDAIAEGVARGIAHYLDEG
jgi:N-acetylmuramoyl-L-alanine amidase